MKREGLLDLNEAVQNPGKHLVFEISTELATEEDLDLLDPVVGTVRAVSTGSILLLEGSFRARVVTECARCGSPTEEQLDFVMKDQFQVEGVPSCYGSDGFAKVLDEDDIPLFVVNALKRDEWIRQGVLLNLSLKPLCREDCPGPDTGSTFLLESGHPSLRGLEGFRQAEETGT